MEVPEAYSVRLASCIFEDTAAFWWDSEVRANFVRRKFNTITQTGLMEAFNMMTFLKQLGGQKSRDLANLK